jgi:hypothetical protein
MLMLMALSNSYLQWRPGYRSQIVIKFSEAHIAHPHSGDCRADGGDNGPPVHWLCDIKSQGPDQEPTEILPLFYL